jgi:hypothetical protein
MKPIFAIDVTNDKKNDKINGEEFITRSISTETQENFNEKTQNFEEAINKSELPLWLSIVKSVCGLFAVMVIAAIFRSISETSLAQIYKNAPWLIISGAICGIAWVGLHIFSKYKEKTVIAEENIEEQVGSINSDINNIYNELGVPYNAQNVDILVFRYADKNGDPKVKTAGIQLAEYFNLDRKIFVRDGYLHIADIENVYSFKLEELRSIKTVRKSITMSAWNKEIAPNEEKYKPFKLGVDQFGGVHAKPYHILTLEHAGEEMGIYFPCYELDTFELLTGLKAEKDSK